jgi:hypothetical protein
MLRELARLLREQREALKRIGSQAVKERAGVIPD